MTEKNIKMEYEKMCDRLRNIYGQSTSTSERDIKLLKDYRKTLLSILHRTVYSLSLEDLEILENSSHWITHYFEKTPLYIAKNKIVKFDIFNKNVTYISTTTVE